MNPKTLSTAITLSNATTLAAGIIMRVAGNAAGSKLQGEQISLEVVENAVAAKLQSNLNPLAGDPL